MTTMALHQQPIYLEHFGLKSPPFRLTPAIDCFFDGGERGEILAAISYALSHGDGIIDLTGEVGTGKTTLSRVLMSRASRRFKFIYIANPSIDRQELHVAVAHELHIADPSPGPGLLRRIQRRLIGLHAAGRQAVLVIDEAHEMPCETLREVRLLSNLETSVNKLLQVVLVGQPELDQVLAQPALRPLRERITHRFTMPALDDRLAHQYLAFRIRRAGGSPSIFSAESVALMASQTGGLARRMNILAEKCLLAAFTEQAYQVCTRHVRSALEETGFQFAGRPVRDSLPQAVRRWVARRLIGTTGSH